jgi:DNA-binding NtrC family response regulator
MLPGAPPFAEVESLIKVRTVASHFSTSDLPILITGEIGTGRRTLANALANMRKKGDAPIVAVSALDGVPREVRLRRGSGSVLVLHDLHALDARGQIEIADLVRDRRLLLVATGKADGQPLVPELAVLLDATQVTLPPLRQRDADILRWADFFVIKAATEMGCPRRKLSPAAKLAVSSHPWPGNLSELESVTRRAVLLSRTEVIEPADLGFAETLVVQPLNEAVENFRMKYVLKVVAHFDGNRTQAARALGIDPRTIFRYLAKAKDSGS